MIVALWIIIPILTYLTIIGLCWNPIRSAVIKGCAQCQLRDGEFKHFGSSGGKYSSGWKNSDYMHSGSSWAALLWPLILPVFAGKMLSNRTASKEVRALAQAEADKVRRQNELDEQTHQIHLARLRAKENDLLDQHLKLEEIRGRVQDR